MKKLLLLTIITLTLLSTVVTYMHQNRLQRPKIVQMDTVIHYTVNYNKFFKVKCSCYRYINKEDDSIHPYITATGFHINKKNPKSDRIVALSRDLLIKFTPNAPFKFGDTIILVGSPFQGLWIVRDCTADYIHKGIDLLCGKNDHLVFTPNVYIAKFSKR